MVSLNVCKENFDVTTFKISMLLMIRSWTFWYMEHLPTLSYTGVKNC